MSLPRISETEWEIMRIVWRRQPITAADIITDLQSHDASWHPVTAKTLLNRLVKKGALGYEQQGRAYLYSAKVTEQDCVALVSSSFLDRVFGGSVATMLAHFVDGRKLSPKQVRDLKQVLEEEAGK
jgi:BlaI family transcriptional regulator, penicillinase repressor